MNGQVNVVTTDKEGVFDSTFLEDMMLSEITQIQKDKSFHDLVCMWNLRGKSNSRKQRVKCWPPGPGGRRRCWSKVTRAQLRRMRKF